MNVWRFFRKFSSVPLSRVMLVAGVSGLSNAMLLTIMNAGAHSVSRGTVNTRDGLLFVIALLLYVLTQRYILQVASREVEKIVRSVRVQLAETIRAADLESIEGLGRARLYAGMNRDTLTISQAAMPLMIAAQSVTLVVFSLVYIFVLSPTAFALTVVIVAFGIGIHLARKRELDEIMTRSVQEENEFFDGLTHLLDGFKEVKLNRARSTDLAQHLSDVATRVADLKTRTGLQNADHYILTQVLLYVLIGAMVFVLPRLSDVYSDDVTRIMAAILFIIGPISLVVSLVPVLRAADQAVQDLEALDADLDRSRRGAASDSKGHRSLADFRDIELSALSFVYPDPYGAGPFTVGPIDLTLRRGEIVLLIGGNGSGKSTFLKLLTGLYYPASGRLSVDGVDVKELGYFNYRELFAAVFSDYHLFDRLYGIGDVDYLRMLELLRTMDLERKTRWLDGRFENQELSTGQRKRLALIVTLLEDKPVYVFDEWAADQDASFRQWFYESMLPTLKAQGKTIVVVTHDDRYFHVGDRVLRMELGKLVEQGPPGAT